MELECSVKIVWPKAFLHKIEVVKFVVGTCAANLILATIKWPIISMRLFIHRQSEKGSLSGEASLLSPP